MKISKVEIKNFRGYGENLNSDNRCFCFPDLDQARVVILSGHNGYGKTSFYEAIEWCLTGDVKSLRKQLMDTNNKVTNKKSHSLKFNSTYDNREREIVVSIYFVDGTRITRKTMNYSLFDDVYKDKIENEKGDSITQNDVNSILRDITNCSEDNFFRLNFCGQTYSGDLIRGVSAKNRGEILMNFLGLDKLNSIINLSDGQKNKTLGAKISRKESFIEEIKRNKSAVEEIFKKNMWGNIVDYKRVVYEKIKEINEIIEKSPFNTIFDMRLLPNDSISELVNNFSIAKIIRERLEQSIEKYKEQKKMLIKNRLLYEYKRQCIFVQDSKIVLDNNVNEVECQLKMLKQKKKANEESITNLKSQFKKIAAFKEERHIGITDATIVTEKMIDKYNQMVDIWKELFRMCKQHKINVRKIEVIVNLEKWRNINRKYQAAIGEFEQNINSQKKSFADVVGIYDEEYQTLIKVQEYISNITNLDKCPICGGSDFYKKTEVPKQKLLEIIATQLSKGDNTKKELNDNILRNESRLKEFKNRYNQKMVIPFLVGVETVEAENNMLIEDLDSVIGEKIDFYEKQMKSVDEQINTFELMIKRIQKFYERFGSEEELLHIRLQRSETVKVWLETVLQNRYNITPNYLQIEDNNRGKGINEINNYIYHARKLKEKLNELLNYDIGSENYKLLTQYQQSNEDIINCEVKLKTLKDANEFRKKVNSISKRIKGKVIDEEIKNNKMINMIYDMINPHPYFREVKIEDQGGETNIKSVYDETVYLDHLFSEAQLRVLSLSIFLGMNLSAKNNRFEQVYIDDPIQSMDDINMASFIDLIRSLAKSQAVNKNFILGTHDDNFSKLLKIKLRNYSFMEYKFVSYSNEGPCIKQCRSLHN